MYCERKEGGCQSSGNNSTDETDGMNEETQAGLWGGGKDADAE